MSLRIARGLFRLWLVLSVLWIGGVAVMTWSRPPVYDFDWVLPSELPSIEEANKRLNEPFDPDLYLREKRDEERRAAIKAIWHASLIAFLPPAFVLALGSALVWAFRGFR
jgi:hypothetical protein